MSESDDRGVPNPRLYYVGMDGDTYNLDDSLDGLREKELIVLQAFVGRLHTKVSGEIHRRSTGGDNDSIAFPPPW